jgi:hypothetical protein
MVTAIQSQPSASRITPLASSDRREQMFPTLDKNQLARIAAIGQRLQVPAGEVLFAQGDQQVRFFVIVSGSVEVVSSRGDGYPPSWLPRSTPPPRGWMCWCSTPAHRASS